VTPGAAGSFTTVTAAYAVLDDVLELLATLVDMVVAHGDEHLIKFTEACLRFHAYTAEPAFLPAARHAAAVLPRP
jgi:hypothetical protein